MKRLALMFRVPLLLPVMLIAAALNAAALNAAALNAAALNAAALTLEQCKSLALENNPGLEIARVDHLSARETARQFHTQRLPALDFSGSYKYQSEVPELVVPPVDIGLGQPITVFDGPMTMGSNDTYDFSVKLSQPLFTGFQMKNQEGALQSLAAGKEMEYRQKKAELLYQVEAGYHNLQKTEMIIDISKTARQQVEAHLRDVQRFYEQGMARKDDVMKAEVRLSEAELSIVQAEHAYATALAYLENITGSSLEAGLALDSVRIGQSMSTDLENAVQTALDHRMEMRTLAALKQAAASSVSAAKGAYMPTVAAFAVMGYGKPGLDFINNEWMDYWVAGVSAEWSLWNWNKTSSKVQSAKLNEIRIDETQNQLVQAIKLDVTRAVLQVKEAIKRLELSEKIVVQTEETFRVIENNFKNGMANNTDFLDVQLDLTRARLKLAGARIDYMLACSNLERAQGTILDQ